MDGGRVDDGRAHGVPEEVLRALADPARRLGRFVLVSELGRGGMGVVWRAWDTAARRFVAVKQLLEPDGELLERFRREAQAGGALDHAGIVTVHEVGEQRGRPYLVLELVEGESLAARLARPISEEELVRTLRALALALAHAHARGVVHRDLKPSNVLLDAEGRPRLTDFGVARLAGAAALTRTGQLVGSPLYMAPEQAAGEVREHGPASDVYALGAILYHGLTGRPPFEAATVEALLKRVLFETPRRPPGPLGDLALRCLAKDPARRPTAAEVARELAAPRAAARRLPWVPVALAGAVVVATVLAVALAPRERPAPPPPSQPAATPGPEEKPMPRHELVATWGSERLRNGTPILSAALAGDRLLTGGPAGARLWSVTTGALERTLDPRPCEAVALSADGARALAGLTLHDLSGGARTLAPGTPTAVAFLPGAREALVANERLERWDLERGARVAELAGHAGRIHAIAVAADGRRALTAGADRRVGVWDLAANAPARWLAHDRTPTDVVFLAGERAASVDDQGDVHFWNLATGELERHLLPKRRQEGRNRLALALDGRTLVWTTSEPVVRTFDLAANRLGWASVHHVGDVTGLLDAGDGERVLTTGLDGSIAVLKAATGNLLEPLDGHRAAVTAIVPSGARVFTGARDGTVRAEDARRDRLERRFGQRWAAVTGVACSPDRREVLVLDATGSVQRFDADTGAGLEDYEGHGVSAVAYLAPGLAVFGRADGRVERWDLAKGGEPRLLHRAAAAVEAVLPLGGERLVVASADGRVVVASAGASLELGTLAGDRRPVAASPRKRLVAGGDPVRLFDLDAHATVELGVRARCLALSPGGELAVGDGATVSLRDRTGRELERIDPGDAPTALAFLEEELLVGTERGLVRRYRPGRPKSP